MKKFNLYFYNSEKLNYEKIGVQQYTTMVGWILIILMGVFMGGIRLGSYYQKSGLTYSGDRDYHKYETHTNEDMSPTYNKVQKDSIFNDYRKRAELYLSREQFHNSPIKSDMLTHCARNAYEKYGIIVPVELALTQAQIESSMGMEGSSPKTNPYNISDNGIMRYMNTTVGGVQAYYDVMCEKYLNCRTTEELLVNFVNCDGHRYASSQTYEFAMTSQFIKTKRWIESNIDN